MAALGRRIHAGYWKVCILSVTYIVHRVDFEEVGWPGDSLFSVEAVGEGRRSACLACVHR